ncbi:PAAR domain-containing protein, partial [Pseudomonas sp. Ant30-3]|uniref:PAAR domain-containing protein n=1 Tax=Pseudomonas sp. Ant30-3 TaxID=1488328 RepID=UPI0015A546F2
NINFMGSARVGDTCGCGAVITTGFPSIQVNGRPMAHLGSPTSHGGTIITGSGDVGGGFVMGDAGGATIINFMALGAFRPDGSVDDEKMATLLADPNLKEKALAANALVDPKAAGKETEEKAEEQSGPAVCKDPDMMEELAGYIASEMNTNIHHPSVLKMKGLLSY